jgi:acetyl esterase/lipase
MKQTKPLTSKNRGYFKLFIFILLATFALGLSLLAFSKQSVNLSSKASTGSRVRYLNPIFSEINTQKDLVYSTINGQQLHLDLYQPKNDTLNLRPAIVSIHAGGFTGRQRGHWWSRQTVCQTWLCHHLH